MLQQELEDVRRLKKEREDALLACKKQLSEVQYELSKAVENAADSDRAADSTASQSLREVSQKLAETRYDTVVI